MAKKVTFKNIEFDHTFMVILTGGRYILVGGKFGTEAVMSKLAERCIKGATNDMLLVQLKIEDNVFRYLAKRMLPDVDKRPLPKECIAIYGGVPNDA